MSDPVGRPQSALVWRIPPYLPAIGFLIVTACAAENIYAQPRTQVRVATIIVGVVIFCVSVASLRMALVVDDEGIAVRYLTRVNWIPWPEVAKVGLADVRGSETVRILRTDNRAVDVPPSLLQPVRPMNKLRASARLGGIVTQITAMRKP